MLMVTFALLLPVWSAAVIVTLPVPLAVTKPVPLTVATFASDEVQVMVLLVALSGKAVAVS